MAFGGWKKGGDEGRPAWAHPARWAWHAGPADESLAVFGALDPRLAQRLGLEGELATHSRRLESTERRGRALRAEIGRKVEELATQESRALREAADWRERAAVIETEQGPAHQELETALAAANKAKPKDDLATLRKVFERVGAAQAKIQANTAQIELRTKHALEREKVAQGLRQQIDDLRKQLQRYSDALENDLAAGRERIATKVKEALTFETSFGEASKLLLTHLRDRPECRDLLEELVSPEDRGLHERRRAPRKRDSG